NLAVNSHSGLPTGWVKSFTDTVNLTGAVTTGLGMANMTLTAVGHDQTINTSCSSFPCPLSQTSGFTYDSGGMNEGPNNPITARATDQGGNLSNIVSWAVKIDRSTPTGTPAWGNGNWTPGTVQTITVPMSDQWSGVKQI